ncbi:MAG: hypothetical protein ACXV5J_07550 [Candidatus Angelobacter sp.]
MECMPNNLRGREYYHPTQEGIQKQTTKSVERWPAL